MNQLKRILLSFTALLTAFALPTMASATNKNNDSDSQKVLRILAIGNSFSEDAVEQNLYEIAQAAGIKLVIGNLYHGGCSLEQHYNYLKDNKPEYNYRKVVDGVKTNRPQTTLDYALEDEHWDFVSFQQSSPKSGIADTYEPFLTKLIDHVKSKVGSNVKLMWYMTWAYAANSKHKGFKTYDNSQLTMYQAIVNATRKVMNDHHFDILIPCGTAIQNARTSYIGDTFCRDGYHLQYVYGRYTAACTWFEAITGRSVVGNTYSPEGIDNKMKTTIQRAVHKAVKHPYKVKKIR